MCFKILNNNNVIINNITYNFNNVFFHLNINELQNFIININLKLYIIKQSFNIDNYINDLNKLFNCSIIIYSSYINNNSIDYNKEIISFNEIFNNIINLNEFTSIKEDLYIIKFNLAYAYIINNYL